MRPRRVIIETMARTLFASYCLFYVGTWPKRFNRSPKKEPLAGQRHPCPRRFLGLKFGAQTSTPSECCSLFGGIYVVNARAKLKRDTLFPFQKSCTRKRPMIHILEIVSLPRVFHNLSSSRSFSYWLSIFFRTPARQARNSACAVLMKSTPSSKSLQRMESDLSLRTVYSEHTCK
jgi:hypothetical protein